MQKRIQLTELQVASFNNLAAAVANANARIALYSTAITEGAGIAESRVIGVKGSELVVEIEDTENKEEES